MNPAVQCISTIFFESSMLVNHPFCRKIYGSNLTLKSNKPLCRLGLTKSESRDIQTLNFRRIRHIVSTVAFAHRGITLGRPPPAGLLRRQESEEAPGAGLLAHQPPPGLVAAEIEQVFLLSREF